MCPWQSHFLRAIIHLQSDGIVLCPTSSACVNHITRQTNAYIKLDRLGFHIHFACQISLSTNESHHRNANQYGREEAPANVGGKKHAPFKRTWVHMSRSTSNSRLSKIKPNYLARIIHRLWTDLVALRKMWYSIFQRNETKKSRACTAHTHEPLIDAFWIKTAAHISG